jgi:hypothetical protein
MDIASNLEFVEKPSCQDFSSIVNSDWFQKIKSFSSKLPYRYAWHLRALISEIS